MELCGAELCGGLVQDKSTPLHLAAKHANSESVRLLLAADSNPNVQDIVSSPPLENVKELCVAELCGGLMQNQCTPLKLARKQGHSDCAKLLNQ